MRQREPKGQNLVVSKENGAVEKIGVVDGMAKYRKKNEMML